MRRQELHVNGSSKRPSTPTGALRARSRSRSLRRRSPFRRRGWLQLPAAGPQRHASPSTTWAGRHRLFLAEARQRPELANLFTSFNSHDAADPGYARSRKGAPAGCADQRRVPGAVGVHGRGLRERFQPVRPPVPRLRPGGAGVPDAGPKTSAALCAQREHERHDPAVHDDHVTPSSGTEVTAVSTCSARWRSPVCRRRATAPGRPWRHSKPLPRSAAARDGLRLFRHVVPGEGGAAGRAHLRPGHRLACSCCSRPSTRAGSCRGPVLLETPLVALGAFFGAWAFGYDNNVYVQVGLVMLIGLAGEERRS